MISCESGLCNISASAWKNQNDDIHIRSFDSFHILLVIILVNSIHFQILLFSAMEYLQWRVATAPRTNKFKTLRKRRPFLKEPQSFASQLKSIKSSLQTQKYSVIKCKTNKNRASPTQLSNARAHLTNSWDHKYAINWYGPLKRLLSNQKGDHLKRGAMAVFLRR